MSRCLVPQHRKLREMGAGGRPTVVPFVGENIRRARKARGMSMVELARAVGVLHSRVGEVERGVASPSLHLLLKIASACGVRPSTLLGELDRLPEELLVGESESQEGEQAGTGE